MNSTKSFYIQLVERFPKFGPEDELHLVPGLNVLVGPPNSGKTAWFRTLDYLWGDPDKPEESLGEAVAKKYEKASATLVIEGETMRVERRWKERGSKTKVFVNGEPIADSDFSSFLMRHLNVPVLRFPQGNPYTAKTWPELTWRQLMRHMYRQERFWGDLVQKQFDVQQHACLALFLGVAEYLFPAELGSLIARRKEVAKLEARKEEFESVLQEVSAHLLEAEIAGITPTPEVIDAEIAKLKASVDSLIDRRDEVLRQAAAQLTPGVAVDLRLSQQRLELLVSLRAQLDRLQDAERRLLELRQYHTALVSEIARIKRTQVAGHILGTLKVTHCPVCDQAVDPPEELDPNCYLCHRPLPPSQQSASVSDKRVEFELVQQQEELAEVEELRAELEKEVETLTRAAHKTQEELTTIDQALRPLQTAIASAVHPEVSLLDARRGQFEERIQQLDRIKGTLRHKESLTELIKTAEAQIDKLAAELDTKNSEADFDRANATFSEGMAEYLSALNKGQEGRWPLAAPELELRERSYSIRVGRAKWSAVLGGTLKAYLFLAYHYALLRLTGLPGFHYPGFSILDFPATLGEGAEIVKAENYLVEPYADLLGPERFKTSQLIVAGRSFVELRGAHRIEFGKVWADS